jgi:hypothetical protein
MKEIMIILKCFCNSIYRFNLNILNDVMLSISSGNLLIKNKFIDSYANAIMDPQKIRALVLNLQPCLRNPKPKICIIADAFIF